ncbi:MAG: hypothetical protein IJ619_02765 [Eubacterium sp.]|nr:hypothetical protein [Eubacterium sp.]
MKTRMYAIIPIALVVAAIGIFAIIKYTKTDIWAIISIQEEGQQTEKEYYKPGENLKTSLTVITVKKVTPAKKKSETDSVTLYSDEPVLVNGSAMYDIVLNPGVVYELEFNGKTAKIRLEKIETE